MQSLARKQGDIVQIPASVAPPSFGAGVPAFAQIPAAPIVPAVLSEPEPRTPSVNLWILAGAAAFVAVAGAAVLRLVGASATEATSHTEDTSGVVAATPAVPAEPTPGLAAVKAAPLPDPEPPAKSAEPPRAWRGHALRQQPKVVPTTTATAVTAGPAVAKPTWDSGPDMGF